MCVYIYIYICIAQVTETKQDGAMTEENSWRLWPSPEEQQQQQF